MTFNQFCFIHLDGLYDPRFDYEDQCNGYKMLRQMILDDITPAAIEGVDGIKYENQYIKGLKFLHPVLRPHIIKYWEPIKEMFHKDENMKKLIDKI